MPFVPVPNVVEAEVRYLLFGQQVENTLYFRNPGIFDESDMTVLGNAVLVWATSSLLPTLSSSLELREIYLTDLTSAFSPAVTIPAPTPHPVGGNINPSLPGNVAACISFRTPLRGRRNRGRNYVPGIPDGGVAGNTLTTTIQNNLLSAYNDLLGPDALVTGWTWVVVHRFTAAGPETTGSAVEVTSVVFADAFSDSQRRRLSGRGI